MGINKRDVRFIIHHSMPKSLDGYIQECGRSGRDGLKSDCILYYKYADRGFVDFFLSSDNQNSSRALFGLYNILQYCEEPYECRRKLQLNFLGEKHDGNCGNCDNCKTK